MSLAKQVAEAFASIPALARVALAEAATQVSLMEAVKRDEFETTLRALTGSEKEREGIRQRALDMARLGLTNDHFSEVLRLYAAGAYRNNEPEGGTVTKTAQYMPNEGDVRGAFVEFLAITNGDAGTWRDAFDRWLAARDAEVARAAAEKALMALADEFEEFSTNTAEETIFDVPSDRFVTTANWLRIRAVQPLPIGADR